jgi:hypothetical protein
MRREISGNRDEDMPGLVRLAPYRVLPDSRPKPSVAALSKRASLWVALSAKRLAEFARGRASSSNRLERFDGPRPDRPQAAHGQFAPIYLQYGQ